jgi:hypothetical protein
MVPGMTCTNGSTSMHCTNGVSCNPSNSSLTSSFSIQATNDSLSQTQHLNLSGQTFTLTGVGTNFSYVNTTSNSTTTSPARSQASDRISKLVFSVKFVVLLAMIFLAIPASAQTNPVQNFFTNLNNEFSGTLGDFTNELEHKLCEAVTSDALSDPWVKAEVELGVMATCFTLLAVAELAGTEGVVVLALPEAGFANTFICLAVTAFIFNNPFDQLATQVCNTLPPADNEPPPSIPPPSSAPATPSPQPGPPPTSTAQLATIPTISESGQAACIVCLIDFSFYEANETAFAVGCNNGFSEYYLPAKYLVRFFCDSSVQTIPPFPSLCASACQTPCEQYSMNEWLAIQPAADEPQEDQLVCESACTGPNGSYTSGDCPVPGSQFNSVCTGLCPGPVDICSNNATC